MSSNRLVRSQLMRKLSDLKKSCNYPVKPNSNPAILYMESVLKPENLSWAPPQQRGNNLNRTVQRVIRAWPKMDLSIKELYEREAEQLTKEYQSAEKEWLEVHGDSEPAKEIRSIQNQLRELQ